jgi:hypothetical protein
MARQRLSFLALGLVLAFASAMKYLSITDESINPVLLGPSWWLRLVGLALETALALWLLCGVYPHLARWATLMAFGLFAVISLARAVSGEASCGCLGALRVSPWVTLAFDLACVALLLTVKPGPVMEEAGWQGAVLLAGASVLAVGVGASAYESVTRISRRLTVEVASHEFGSAEQRQQLTHTFKIRNECGFAVELAQATGLDCPE